MANLLIPCSLGMKRTFWCLPGHYQLLHQGVGEHLRGRRRIILWCRRSFSWTKCNINFVGRILINLVNFSWRRSHHPTIPPWRFWRRPRACVRRRGGARRRGWPCPCRGRGVGRGASRAPRRCLAPRSPQPLGTPDIEGN